MKSIQKVKKKFIQRSTNIKELPWITIRVVMEEIYNEMIKLKTLKNVLGQHSMQATNANR